ncbi:hypothetical protein [Amorphus coralli]|uniref:hypothetical protein n=1 Tax=Amorphus coralli TaxID=340680 RepID=UPI0003FFE81A|nr:hypothetical protein [Amorphus coralli]
MPALSRLPKSSRPAPDKTRAPAETPAARAARSPSPHLDVSRLTTPAQKGQNRSRSDAAGSWLPAGSLDRDVDTIAATVDRLVSALNSRDWMTPPPISTKADRSLTGADAQDTSREADDLAFAEGADFREIARRIAEFRKSRPDPAQSSPAPARRIVRRTASGETSPLETVASPEADARAERWDADWRADPNAPDAAPAAEETREPDSVDSWALKAQAALDAPATGEPHDARWADIAWPKASTARNATPTAPEAGPATGESSLRQRLAALRARVSGTAAESAEPTPDGMVAAEAPAFDDGLREPQTIEARDAQVAHDSLPAEIPLDEAAAEAPLDDAWIGDADDASQAEEIETWGTDGDNEDVSNESLLAAPRRPPCLPGRDRPGIGHGRCRK